MSFSLRKQTSTTLSLTVTLSVVEGRATAFKIN
jgi:hypothetical protein